MIELDKDATIDRETLRLPPEEYYPEEHPKAQIVLHHTVGGSAKSTFNWWKMDRAKSGGLLKVGTAYIIERDGKIYEVFDPKYWAHHLGLSHKDNLILNQRSIGIELASEGALTMGQDKELHCFGDKLYKGKGFVFLPEQWRGYQYFDAYEEAQIDSCIRLVLQLCERFKINRHTIDPADEGRFGLKFFEMPGVIGHCNVRSDKSDPHPRFPWDRLRKELQPE